MSIIVTQSTGCRRKHVKGCRITWTCSECNEILDQLIFPTIYGGIKYVHDHPKGEYARIFREKESAVNKHRCKNE